MQRLEVLREYLKTVSSPIRIPLEPEIKAIMLEMLVNNFFGLEIPYEQIRNQYVPALERVVEHIVRDTVINKLGISIWTLPSISQKDRFGQRSL